MISGFPIKVEVYYRFVAVISEIESFSQREVFPNRSLVLNTRIALRKPNGDISFIQFLYDCRRIGDFQRRTRSFHHELVLRYPMSEVLGLFAGQFVVEYLPMGTALSHEEAMVVNDGQKEEESDLDGGHHGCDADEVMSSPGAGTCLGRNWAYEENCFRSTSRGNWY